MRKIILALLVGGVPAAAFAADEAPASAAQSSRSYTVIKGDTLWDLAGKFYQNPYAWPTLWNANRLNIKDPNRIYPRQIFVVPGTVESTASAPPSSAAPYIAPSAKSSAPAPSPAEENAPQMTEEDRATALANELAGSTETEPPAVPSAPVESSEPDEAAESGEPAEETEEDIPPREPQETAVISAPEAELPPVTMPQPPAGRRYYSADAFVMPPDWRADGAIVGDRDKKLMISEGDTVYTNLGARRVEPGTQCVIYRRLAKVRDPETGEMMGYEVRLIGRISVTDAVGKKASTAKVINSREPIEIGDVLEIIR